MGRKRNPTGSIKCRYECGATFGSMNGRAAHERKIHGEIFTKRTIKNSDSTPISTPVKTSDVKTDNKQIFIEVSEVKFMAANKVAPKNEKKPDFENECGGCGYEYNGTAKFCPGCGVEFE